MQAIGINSIRAYLAEFGIVAPVGRRGVEQLLEVVADTADRRLPEVARACSQLRALKAQILEFARPTPKNYRNSSGSGVGAPFSRKSKSHPSLADRTCCWKIAPYPL